MIAPAGRAGPGAARGNPCDVRPVEGGSGIDGQLAPRTRSTEDEAPRHDHLRRRVGTLPLREARRVGEPARVEGGVRLVDPVVDDRDLHAGARRAARGREGCGADDAGAAVRLEVVPHAGIDAGDRAECVQSREAPHGEVHGDPVEDHLEPVAELRAGDRRADRSGGGGLLRVDAREIRTRRGACGVQPALAERREEPRPVRGGERRQPQRRDHRDLARALRPRNRERSLRDPGYRDLAEGAVDGLESRGRRRCEGKRRDRNDEHELTAQEQQGSRSFRIVLWPGGSKASAGW